MTNVAEVLPLLTVEEFLLMRPTTHKVELVEGTIYNMAGAAARHNTVTVNAVFALTPAARRLACDLFANDMAVKVGPTTAYYPDVVVACDNEGDSDLVRSKPCLIIEVLSPSTAGTDKREKRVAYQRIASMKDYLIVDPKTHTVDHHHRENAETWSWTVRGKDDVCTQTCLGDVAINDLFIGLTPTEAEPEF
jgi:Uma2 family endonuclease